MGGKKAETPEESVSYRSTMQIKEVMVREGKMFDFHTKYTFPICPRCDNTMEYDYQKYCGCCGQKLGWAHYSRAKPRYPGEEKNDRFRQEQL